MEIVILTRTGNQFRTYDATWETPADALANLQQSPEQWLKVGSVVVRAVDVAAVYFPELEADRS